MLIPSNAYTQVFLTSLATMHYNKGHLNMTCSGKRKPSATDVVASSEDYYRDFSAYKGRVLLHTRTLLNHEQNSIKHLIGTIIAILL